MSTGRGVGGLGGVPTGAGISGTLVWDRVMRDPPWLSAVRDIFGREARAPGNERILPPSVLLVAAVELAARS